MFGIFDDDLRKIAESYVNEVYNPRSRFPSVRGGWTKSKIKRYIPSSRYGLKATAEFIAEYDSVEDLKNHMFYHGTPYGTSKGMIPSIKQGRNWDENSGSGGYGKRYWGISVTPSKKIASNFSSNSDSMTIYPILLAKHAVVEEAPNISDAVEVEEIIEDYWNRGVDAIKLGDSSEDELLVLNPAAICNRGEGDFYHVYRLGQEMNPLRSKSDDDIAKMYEFAKEYLKNPRFREPKKPKKPIEPARSYYSDYDKTLNYYRRNDDGTTTSISKEEYDSLMKAYREHVLSEYERKMKEYYDSEDYRSYVNARDEARRTLSF